MLILLVRVFYWDYGLWEVVENWSVHVLVGLVGVCFHYLLGGVVKTIKGGKEIIPNGLSWAGIEFRVCGGFDLVFLNLLDIKIGVHIFCYCNKKVW